MIIAQERRKRNIAEYLIYMFQVEDVIRALEFDENNIQNYVKQTFTRHQEKLDAINNWYLGLNDLMLNEKIKEKGHLSIVLNNIKELEDFHIKLMNNSDYQEYQQNFKSTVIYIKEFRERSNALLDNDIMICLHAVYSKFLLKLKNVDISEDTEVAFEAISKLLAQLSHYFMKYESGKIEL